jgi:hypothetical protein
VKYFITPCLPMMPRGLPLEPPAIQTHHVSRSCMQAHPGEQRYQLSART